VQEARRKDRKSAPLAEQIDFDTYVRLRERQYELPALEVDLHPRRRYPLGREAAHVLGYTGKITEEEYRDSRRGNNGQGYAIADMVGRDGIERLCETRLRGTPGGMQIEVDALGRKVRELSETIRSPVGGCQVELHIDIGLQRVCREALGNRPGAVVVLDPRNGAVRALVSMPDFDPNTFPRGDQAAITRLVQDPTGKPLLDRAISGYYPPGSLFKPIVAVAGLEEGILTSRRRFFCSGVKTIGEWKFRCWNEFGHGWLNVAEAIQHSCNVFFYEIAEDLGVKRLSEYARAFGLGSHTGIDLPGEEPGIVPTKKWKWDVLGQPWYRGDNLHYSIGQGYVLVTPLQTANVFAAIANGGTLYRPQVVARIKPLEGKPRVIKPEVIGEVPNAHLGLIREALRRVVNRRGGTAYEYCRISGLTVAGKTGTAQVSGGEPHSWFVGFAPFEDPRVVILVLVEHGGSGAQVAAPIAREIFLHCFPHAAPPEPTLTDGV